LSSLGTVIVNRTRSFLVRDMSHKCEHKHINMRDTIYDNIIQYHMCMNNMLMVVRRDNRYERESYN
jgi:hypothetical protein